MKLMLGIEDNCISSIEETESDVDNEKIFQIQWKIIRISVVKI